MRAAFVPRRLIVAVLLAAVAAGSSAQTDTVPQRPVCGNTLNSESEPAVSIDESGPFRYVGAQRFVLRGHTDVEQYFFLVASEDGAVQRLYWLQFEAKLPQNESVYRYPGAATMEIGDVDFVTHVRYYDAEPVDNSDRGAAYRFLASQGYTVPTPAIRCRLIYVPDDDERRELMIVYLEDAPATGDLDNAARAAIVERAAQGLAVRVID